MDKKRERGKNYTETEKYTLLEIVADYLHIIENKKTDDKNAKKKKGTWDVIANKYNAIQQTGIRTGAQLKLLYDNIKQKAKKDKADEKVELYKTGGGTFCKKVDGISEKFLHINKDAILELANVYDSSAKLAASDDTNVPIVVEVIDDMVQSGTAINPSLGFNQFKSSSSSSPVFMNASPIPINYLSTSENTLYINTDPATATNPSLRYNNQLKSPFFEELSLSPSCTNVVSTPKSSFKSKNTLLRKKIKEKSKKSVDKEQIKLEILKIRLEKEIIEKDVLLLKKKEKYLNIKQKKINLKILARNENLTISKSDSE